MGADDPSVRQEILEIVVAATADDAIISTRHSGIRLVDRSLLSEKRGHFCDPSVTRADAAS
jgi:hypothetical protein